MNTNIINEFSKLLAYLKDQMINLRLMVIKRKQHKQVLKFKQLSTVYNILKKYPTEITIDNYMELKEVNGIGKGTLNVLKKF